MLIRVIKNWAQPDLLRQSANASGHWGNVCFTLEPVEECDAVVVLNHVAAPTRVRCSPDNIWVLMQEPYVCGIFDWMVEGHDQYAHVFTHYPPRNNNSNKYVRCQPALPWHVNRSYDELKAQAVPAKQKDVSWITSNLTVFPGHKVRMKFLEYLRSRNAHVDLYGKGINFIEDKWDGLAPYRYSLAIENHSGPEYWTEKIADCFLSWTVPIYYGCTNLEEYFPPESFIKIDITRPESAWSTIAEAMASDNWDARVSALKEARSLVLDRYQFFPQVKRLVEQYYQPRPESLIELEPYRQRHSLFTAFRRRLSRFVVGA